MLKCCYANINYLPYFRRLDYFLTSERFADKVVDNVICANVLGSDHCPITLFLNL